MATEEVGSPHIIQWLRYVVHSEIEKYKALGWEISDDLSGTSHGRWSVLMQWKGEGEPPNE